MSLPFEIKEVEPELQNELKNIFKKRKDGFVYVGPKKYTLFSKYRKEAPNYFNLEVRPDDLWIVTFPRSGTTWAQEMLWLLNNDLDYEKATKMKHGDRFVFLEYTMLIPDETMEEAKKLNKDDPSKMQDLKNNFTPAYEKIPKMVSPRHIKSHMPLSLLPPKLLDTCKVVYVARNPKDVAVSYFHFSKHLKFADEEMDFSLYWDLFQRNLIQWTPFWSHVEEAWCQRDHRNMLFLFYEDMKRDLPAVIRKTADFLGKQISEEQINRLAAHLDINNFRKNPSMRPIMDRLNGLKKEGEQGFYRQGESGAWRSTFSPELNAKADEWIRENEKLTDLRFQF